ncbi:hypothetical protein [Haloechinothrix sp. LS1_15]|uniref:hypothetical protein n=1 Tax=Haloechinothrix sp. LS1_15 TaxID=2652248 RepID=UPI00294489D1|nr:hypothetical protein [Haloechinothrix sp. LS1_15]MDV6012333.1 hypothetical protein [Haloechinothrix sp. LS1_15]
MTRRSSIAAGAAALLVLAGCSPGPASGSGADVVDGDGESTEAVDSAESGETGDGTGDGDAGDGGEYGTRDNPLEVGTTIEVAGWELAVTEVTPDATDEILAENEFNEPPADGRQFVMFGVAATYVGEDSGTAWTDFSWAVVGGDGNTFGAASLDDYCGVIPEPLADTGETFPGGQVSGNVCIAVPAEQLERATIRIEELLSIGDTRAFYALD